MGLRPTDHVSTIDIDGERFLRIDPAGLTLLAEWAFKDISHLLRSGHLGQLRAILDDPEATRNDRFVALEMLKNAVIAADQVLPMCQDTGQPLSAAHAVNACLPAVTTPRHYRGCL